MATFNPGQRVEMKNAGKHEIGTVKYVGSVEGHDGIWVGVDWDSGHGRHDGIVNGVRYFGTSGSRSGSLVRPAALSTGTSLLNALISRYKTSMTEDDAEEMYLMSVRQRKVAVELVGQSKVEEKQKHLDELPSATLVYAGVSTTGPPGELSSSIPNVEELDLTGNLIPDWKFVNRLCEELPALRALDLSCNRLRIDPGPRSPVHLRTIVLNCCFLTWKEVEILRQSLPTVEEFHLRQNSIKDIEPSDPGAEGFKSLRVLNLEDNSIDDWNKVLRLSGLQSLRVLNLSGNSLEQIFYNQDNTHVPFSQLSSLYVAKNRIADWESVDALDKFPKLQEIRLSENPITDTTTGGAPRYILVARLSKITALNGSEVKPRERKDSEIRYVRHVINTAPSMEAIKKNHPRFEYLKKLYDISEDTVPQQGAHSSQNMAASLSTITIRCVAASVGEMAPVTRKLPGSMTVGKLKQLCEALFKLKLTRQRVFLEEKESPLPLPLDDDLESLANVGIGQQGVILVDEGESF